MTFFLVDCEATGKSPYSGVLTEFGVVELDTLESYYGKLYDSMPSEENPAVPVLVPGERRYSSRDVFIAMHGYLDRFPPPYVFVSDNPAYDFMWIAYTLDQYGFDNPFGHSARRIGDFAAGLSKNWRNTNKWKKLRVTKHTHNPVDDAMGNAEALRRLLGIDQPDIVINMPQ